MWVFLACTFFGAAVLNLAASVREGVLFIWTIADIATGLMMIPNLYALCVLGGKVKALTADYLAHAATGRPFAIAPFANAKAPAAKPAARPGAKRGAVKRKPS
jgi:hypothetical protein